MTEDEFLKLIETTMNNLSALRNEARNRRDEFAHHRVKYPVTKEIYEAVDSAIRRLSEVID